MLIKPSHAMEEGTEGIRNGLTVLYWIHYSNSCTVSWLTIHQAIEMKKYKCFAWFATVNNYSTVL